MPTCRPFPCRWLSGVALFCLTAGAVSSVRADILALDWSHLSATYKSGAANAATAQNFTVGSYTVSTVFGNTTSQFALNSPTVATNGAAAPNDPSYSNGGVSDTALALQIGINLTDSATQDIKFTINFSQAVYGATFRLFDVDGNMSATGFVDQVRNILGTYNGTTSLPTITGSADNSVGTSANNATAGLSNSVTGVTSAGNDTGDGNATVTFANNVPITSISFIYGDNRSTALGTVAPRDASQQLIALSNITWSTVSGQSVPEPGMFAAIGLGIVGLAAFASRGPLRH